MSFFLLVSYNFHLLCVCLLFIFFPCKNSSIFSVTVSHTHTHNVHINTCTIFHCCCQTSKSLNKLSAVINVLNAPVIDDICGKKQQLIGQRTDLSCERKTVVSRVRPHLAAATTYSLCLL